MLFMPDLFSDPPYILLILGFALLFAAVVSTRVSEDVGTPSWLVYRAKDPVTSGVGSHVLGF